MYNSLFGFITPPFENNLDQRFLFLGQDHEEVLAALHYFIREKKGLGMVCGDVGTGKTMLLQGFLDKLPASVHSIVISNPLVDHRQLLDYIATTLGIPPGEETLLGLLDRIKETLIAANERGETILLIIDEAHLLPDDSLEHIRLLFNIETPQCKLLQILLAGYFDRNRWDYYRLRAEGHNTLVLNPGSGPDQNPEAAANIFRFRSGAQLSLAIADLTPAYARQAQRVWRGVSLVSRRQVLVQDEIQAEKPVEVLWALHTEAEVRLNPDNRTAYLSLGGARLAARILFPPEAVFKLLSAQPGPLSPHPMGQAENRGVSKLAIHVQEVQDLRLAVALTPLTGEPGPEFLEMKITPLAQW